MMNKRIRNGGFSYVEVVIATALIAISLIPAMEAINASMATQTLNANVQQQHYWIEDKFERLMTESFATLDDEALSIADPAIPSALYSDSAGSANRRLVFLSRYDADNDDADDNTLTGGDKGMLWLRVSLENSRLERQTLLSDFR